MLVFWKERLVVLSVPKTGTTALQAVLAPHAAMVLRDPPGLKHATLGRYRRHVAPLLATTTSDRFETLAVIREPVDWLSSWHRYRSRADLAGHPNSTNGVSFRAFVEEYCQPRPAPFAAVGSQARYVLDPDGRPDVDYLFRHDDRGPLMAFLEARLGRSIDMPRLNVSPEREADLPPEGHALLRRAHPAEFAAWAAAGRNV